MKQLSALGARRHAFFRGPRRMRPLGGRLEDPDILGPAAYGYYGGKKESSSSQYMHVCTNQYVLYLGIYCIANSCNVNVKYWTQYIEPVCTFPQGFQC